jgi:hypothetical protein
MLTVACLVISLGAYPWKLESSGVKNGTISGINRRPLNYKTTHRTSYKSKAFIPPTNQKPLYNQKLQTSKWSIIDSLQLLDYMKQLPYKALIHLLATVLIEYYEMLIFIRVMNEESYL